MDAKNMLIFCLACFPLAGISGQESIELENPSFEEDEASASMVPSGWINLGAEDQSPPDIQPGFWRVNIPAQDGRTYLGLVVRENNTWEGVGQYLFEFLKKDTAYSFSLWLTRSTGYRSPTNLSNQLVSFNAATILKIWGHNTKTNQEELLAESQPVGHSKWVRYEFILKPTLCDYDELDLMAYYAPGAEKMNGNLLIDNCSTIVMIKK